MSEYVKPRQFWFNFKIGPNESIIQNQIVYMIKNSKHDFHVIELEPTLQLMEEMAKSLEQINKEEINSMRPGGGFSMSARISYEALEKYRKFKEGLK
jgi:hypothetical protein